MRLGELWDPPPATVEHRELVIEVLDAALNASRTGDAKLTDRKKADHIAYSGRRKPHATQ
jgi:hypothetical protein